MISRPFSKAVRPHIPLIKFRKGGPYAAPAFHAADTFEFVVPVVPHQPQQHHQPQAFDSPALEWWQVPAKFKRRTIDLSECDSINVSPASGLDNS